MVAKANFTDADQRRYDSVVALTRAGELKRISKEDRQWILHVVRDSGIKMSAKAVEQARKEGMDVEGIGVL